MSVKIVPREYDRVTKRIARALVALVPAVLIERILRAAALAPPAMKTPIFERACAALSRVHSTAGHGFITTNFGISRHIRCDLPKEKVGYLFGRPGNSVAERATLSLARELSRDCSHFIDVGANEGLFTLAVADSAAGALALHWFEPDRALFDRLELNLARNKIAAKGNRVAISDRHGNATFFKNISDDLSGSLSTYFDGHHQTVKETVETLPLSEYLTAHQISDALVKIDVEGHGNQVWSGAAAGAANIKYLLMEMLEPEIRAGTPQQIISQSGWHAYYIKDFDLIESRNGEFDYVAPFWNWLFCALTPAALSERLKGTKFRVLSNGRIT